MNIILLASIGACLAAGSFFVVTIFSLQRMLSDQRSAEDRLRESEQMLRAVVDNSTALITVKAPDGRYLLMNSRFQRRFGILAVEAVGAADAELFAPDLADSLATGDEPALRAREALEFDQRLVVDGEERSFITVKFPLLDGAGRESAVCSIMTDVTARRRLEEERSRLFDLSLDILVATDFGGVARLVNPRFEKTLGWTPEETYERKWIDLVHPDDRDATLEGFRELRTGRPVINFENRVRCKDGGYKRLSWRVMPAIEHRMAYAVAREVVAATHEAEPGKVVPLHATADRTKS